VRSRTDSLPRSFIFLIVRFDMHYYICVGEPEAHAFAAGFGPSYREKPIDCMYDSGTRIRVKLVIRAKAGIIGVFFKVIPTCIGTSFSLPPD
jgi:hypothetical protein